jgi:hypothetical protein
MGKAMDQKSYRMRRNLQYSAGVSTSIVMRRNKRIVFGIGAEILVSMYRTDKYFMPFWSVLTESHGEHIYPS